MLPARPHRHEDLLRCKFRLIQVSDTQPAHRHRAQGLIRGKGYAPAAMLSVCPPTYMLCQGPMRNQPSRRSSKPRRSDAYRLSRPPSAKYDKSCTFRLSAPVRRSVGALSLKSPLRGALLSASACIVNNPPEFIQVFSPIMRASASPVLADVLMCWLDVLWGTGILGQVEGLIFA